MSLSDRKKKFLDFEEGSAKCVECAEARTEAGDDATFEGFIDVPPEILERNLRRPRKTSNSSRSLAIVI
jgi:hypothetical protein